MLEFVIIAFTMVMCLIVAVVYLMPGGKRLTTVPGPEQVDTVEGNIPDIVRSGGLYKYLMNLHDTFGPIASFWWGPKLTVSIASPQLFKEHTKPFDRPAELFQHYQALIGPHAILLANGQDGRNRHAMYARCFSTEAMNKYYGLLNKLTSEFVQKWSSLPAEEHIPLRQYMMAHTIKAMLRAAMGNFFSDDTRIQKIRQAYDYIWGMLEENLLNKASNTSSAKQEKFDKQIKIIQETVMECIEFRRKNPPTAAEHLLIDAVLELDMSDDTTFSDLISVFVAGFHTAAFLLVWVVYFLASHPDVQEKVYQEIVEVVGDDSVDTENIKQLRYMNQVLNETMRCCNLGNIAARVQDEEIVLGGHKMPAGTTILHALCVLHQDKELYPEPTKFDPERFSPENVKKRPNFSFEPFGFAGKRKCLGYRFSQVDAKMLLCEILRRFKVSLIEGQVVTRVYGVTVIPKDEICVSVSQRTG